MIAMTTGTDVPSALGSWWPSLGAVAFFAFAVFAVRRQRRHLEQGRGGWPQRQLDYGSGPLLCSVAFFALGMIAGRIAVLAPSMLTRVTALAMFLGFVVFAGVFAWRLLSGSRTD
jgi:uncharacterized membrane protein YgdD (TMEM256/DUF423 family)